MAFTVLERMEVLFSSMWNRFAISTIYRNFGLFVRAVIKASRRNVAKTPPVIFILDRTVVPLALRIEATAASSIWPQVIVWSVAMIGVTIDPTRLVTAAMAP
jgi:hypothetical protein